MMPRMWLYLGVVSSFCFSGASQALAQSSTTLPADSALPRSGSSTAISELSSQVPASTGNVNAPESNGGPKFYTFTADIREGYDDNIYTSKSHQTASSTTDADASVLVHFPMDNSEFAASLSFGANYFQANTSFDVTSSFLARFTHRFSDRFSLDVRDSTGYFTEPSILQSTGTLYRDGGYINNSSSADLSAQWSPLVSTTTSYSNNVVFYDNSAISKLQDSMENTAAQSVGFAIYPKFSLVFAGSFDNADYSDVARGYTSISGTGGINWQALPTLSLGFTVGASETLAEHTGSSSNLTPTGTLSANWSLGAKSHLDFSYSHSVVPTDVSTASGQEADRFSAGFTYEINRSFSTHFNGIFTYSDYTTALIRPNTTGSFTEEDSDFETGLTYHISKHFDADCNYTFTDVTSGENLRDYDRNQIVLGLHATY